MIVGCGVDVVDVARVARVVDRWDARFQRRILTERERAQCTASRQPARQMALRFAAKEAGMKAIGTGWARGVSWKDFEVLRGRSGFELRLSGRAAEVAREQGSARVWVAVALTRTHAIAQVVLESAPGGGRS